MVKLPKGSRFERIVPENKTGSCGMTAMTDLEISLGSLGIVVGKAFDNEGGNVVTLLAYRNFLSPNCLMSTPSILIDPEFNSTILSNATINWNA